MNDDTKGKPLDPTQDSQDTMSDVVKNDALETASEVAEPTDEELDKVEEEMQEVLPDVDPTALATHAAKPPSVVGEQSISGDMPAPESDDDTLQNAQAAGFQIDEDEEHPQPIDAARDIDKAEQAIKES